MPPDRPPRPVGPPPDFPAPPHPGPIRARRSSMGIAFQPALAANPWAVRLCRNVSKHFIPIFGKNILHILSDYDTFYLTGAGVFARSFTTFFQEESSSYGVCQKTAGCGYQRRIPAPFDRGAPKRTGSGGGGRDRRRSAAGGAGPDAGARRHRHGDGAVRHGRHRGAGTAQGAPAGAQAPDPGPVQLHPRHHRRPGRRQRGGPLYRQALPVQHHLHPHPPADHLRVRRGGAGPVPQSGDPGHLHASPPISRATSTCGRPSSSLWTTWKSSTR